MPDTATDAAAFIKKATDFAMGSWWLGGTYYVPNDGFMAEVGPSGFTPASNCLVTCWAMICPTEVHA